MNYEIERTKGEVKISYTVSGEEWNKEVEKAYLKSRSKYKVQGFRPGKAPRKVIEQYYGPAVFFDDAFNTCASMAYSDCLKANDDIYPVDEPKVNIDSISDGTCDLKFTMTVTVKPEVKLGAYKGLTIDKAEYPVTKEDVEKDIAATLERQSRTVKIEDRAVKNGDIVNLDYSGTIDGVKFNGGTAAGQTLEIGSNSFIPGFEDQMIGMKIGKNKDINVKFPDDYHSEEVKGKNAVFNVTVNEISVKEVPELNDELVKDISKFDTVAEYRADVEKRLKESAANREENENKNNLIAKITENAEIDIPECMINDELEYMLEDFGYRLMYAYGGMKLDDYFKYTNSSREDFKKDRRDEALLSVKTRLALQEVIKTENLGVSDEDMDARLRDDAEKAGKDFEEYKASQSAQTLERIKNDLLVTKTLDALVAANTFKAPAKKAAAKKDGDGAEKKTATAAKKTTAKPKNE